MLHFTATTYSPKTLLILFSWLVLTCSNLFIICSWIVHNLFVTCSWPVHNLFMTCAQLAHDLFMSWSWLVHGLLMDCLISLYELFMNYWWHVTCSWLIHNLFINSIMLSTWSMLPEYPRFYPGTHPATSYFKGVQSMALYLFKPYFLSRGINLNSLPFNIFLFLGFLSHLTVLETFIMNYILYQVLLL